MVYLFGPPRTLQSVVPCSPEHNELNTDASYQLHFQRRVVDNVLLMCVYVCMHVIISCVQNISSALLADFDEILWRVGAQSGSNHLDFGGDPFSFVDPGSFSRIR